MKRAILLALSAFFFLFIIQPNLKDYQPVEYKVPSLFEPEAARTNLQAAIRQSQSQARIVLDLGEVESESLESRLLWQIGEKTAARLSEAGYIVLFDEEKSDPNSLDDGQRLEKVRSLKPDVVLQLRLNTSQNPAAKGYALFVQNKKEPIALADEISKQIARIDFSDYLGLDSDHYGNFSLLKEEDLFGVLLQIGYVSNEEELAKLQNESYQQALAGALCNAFLTIIS